MIDKPRNSIDKFLGYTVKKFFHLTGLHSQVVSTSFGEMHYYDSDPKSHLRPLIFIHGLGSSGQSWWVLAKMLINKRRILIPDLFHMAGESKASNDQMDIFAHADSIKEFIDKVAKEYSSDDQQTASSISTGVDLCGLSLGGWVSMILAAKHANKVHKLILLNTAGIKLKLNSLHNTIRYVDPRKFRSVYPGIMKAFPFSTVPGIRHFARYMLYSGLKSEGVQKFVTNTKIDHFIDDLLPLIECPVLVLWGKDDEFLSSQTPEVLMKKIRNITAKWVHNCAHVLPLEAPLNCYQEINSFLNLSTITDNKFCRLMFSYGRIYPVTNIEIE